MAIASNSMELLHDYYWGKKPLSGWIKGKEKIEWVHTDLWDSNFLALEKLVERATPASKCDYFPKTELQTGKGKEEGIGDDHLKWSLIFLSILVKILTFIYRYRRTDELEHDHSSFCKKKIYC